MSETFDFCLIQAPFQTTYTFVNKKINTKYFKSLGVLGDERGG